MYYETEIPTKKSWTSWLSDFKVNERKEIDKKDRSKIATSISNTFHKHGTGKFKIYTEGGNLYVKRMPLDEVTQS